MNLRLLPAFVSCSLGGCLFLACGTDPAQDLDEGDRVTFQHLLFEGDSSDGSAGASGVGGAGGAGEAPEGPPEPVFCFEQIITEGGLPECFVAEAGDDLDCTADGREPLREEWDRAVREQVCVDGEGLFETSCADITLCGIVKLTGADAVACAEDDPSAPGYCLTDQVAESCDALTQSSLEIVTRAEYPLFSEAPKLVYAFCAVESGF